MASAVKILTRMCTILDGWVTTADGLPIQLAFPAWDAGALDLYELQERVPVGSDNRYEEGSCRDATHG